MQKKTTIPFFVKVDTRQDLFLFSFVKVVVKPQTVHPIVNHAKGWEVRTSMLVGIDDVSSLEHFQSGSPPSPKPLS